MKKLTSRDTRAVWREICDDRNIRIVVVSDIVGDDVYNMAVGVLTLFGVDAREALSSRYVSLPGYIICPTKIGGRRHSERVQQLGTLAHELTHHNQMNDAGGWHRWMMDYWRNRGNRCEYEGQAYGGDADMAAYFGMTQPKPGDIFNAEFRRVYRVNNRQMGFARRAYERQLAKLERGRPSTKAAAEIAKKLRERGYSNGS